MFTADRFLNVLRAAIRESLILLLYAAVSAMVLNVFMQTRSLEEGSAQFGLAMMLDGTAERPYVYRQLVPMVVNRLASIVPEDEHRAFVEYHLDRFHLKQIYFGRAKFPNGSTEEWTATYSLKFHLTYLVLFVSLLSFLYLLRLLGNAVSPGTRGLNAFAPIGFAALLPLSFLHGNFYYDFVELFFLAALLLCAMKRRYELWLILFPLAVFNKESNILAPLLYLPILWQNARRGHSAIAVVLSGLLAAGAFVLLRHWYSGNAGSPMLWQLSDNLEFWTAPRSYFLWTDFYAPLIPFPRGANILLICLFVGLTFTYWREKPAILKWLLASTAAINLPLLLLFCTRDELRNLSLVFVPLYLLSILSIHRLFLAPETHTVDRRIGEAR